MLGIRQVVNDRADVTHLLLEELPLPRLQGMDDLLHDLQACEVRSADPKGVDPGGRRVVKKHPNDAAYDIISDLTFEALTVTETSSDNEGIIPLEYQSNSKYEISNG